MELLKNELGPLIILLRQEAIPEVDLPGQACFSCQFRELSGSIRLAWETAAFSGANKVALKRYFSYHMNVLRELVIAPSDCSYEFEFDKESIIGLMTHLYTFFRVFLSDETVLDYRLLVLPELDHSFKRLVSYLEDPRVNRGIADCLLPALYFLLKREDDTLITAGSLKYLENLALKLLPVLVDDHDINEDLVDLLLSLNFNHHGFFKYLVKAIRVKVESKTCVEQRDYILMEYAGLPKLADDAMITSFNPVWPPLTKMLRNWLAEEAATLEKRIREEEAMRRPSFKLPFKLSVAQHACLSRLLYEVGIYDTTVANVIKFNADNSSTKRTLAVSEGSYEMQYYSITQKTAAVILDLLQKMTSNLKRSFFPLWVAIVLIVGAH
ncbi:hypothetical protein [Mucilaginibacter sp. FT3.2]|uniref:hypothetical protein n=1 Tax=Mucilaginibacter sp. FT3.2 TaxID=2723090 RepID=UPI001613928A|nr:hypothetical protein [Mucilaginibacter sp. FT3.2]MBB6234194.1 hypothetical protein [Mucilaginibacter sp. FT3.2]